MTKGIFIDLDGTLLNDEHELTNNSKNVLRQIADQGIFIYLITGMSREKALKWYEELGLKTFLITSMGQVISKPGEAKSRNIIHSNIICSALKAIDDLAKSIKINNFAFETVDGELIVGKQKHNSDILKLIGNEKITLFEKDAHAKLETTNTYVEVENTTIENLDRIVSKLNKQNSDFLYEYWIPENNLPIIHLRMKSFGKWDAIEYIKTIDKLDTVIAFGNGWNDRFVLQNADLSFAMLNAKDVVKKFATRVTERDNNNDGVVFELKKLLANNELLD